jgi:hypothetical protein
MNWPAWYEVRIAELLEDRWQQWFLDLDLAPVPDPCGPGTLLRGKLRDPAALFGALARMGDLNLTVVAVRRMEQAGGWIGN